jgi:hypothetical protein
MVRKLLSSLALGVLLMSLSSSVNAAGCDSCNDGCSTVCCPSCDCVCKLKAEMVDADKHCWKVECKKICVPKFVFPWKKSCCDPCAHNGAWTREINILKKHSYTCPKCEYSWSPKDDTCDSDKCCNSCASCSGGCDSCCAEAIIEGATSSEESSAPTPADDAGPSLDIPPAPPAPSASKRFLPKFRAAKTGADARATVRTSALQTALQKLRK